MKEQVKTKVSQGVEDGKMKGEGMTNLKFNVIIVTNMVIMLMNVEVPLIIRKDKPIMFKRKIKKNPLFCWLIKEKVKREIYDILKPEKTIMCGFKNMFVELNKSESGHVTFGDASKIPMKGKGKILIRLKNEKHQFISNVYFIPDMKNNILNFGQLLEKGYDFHMRNQSISIRDQHVNIISNGPIKKI